MRPSRALTLKKETLAPLSGDDLGRVGGAARTYYVQECLAILASVDDPGYCISERYAACNSYLRPCITHTCTR